MHIATGNYTKSFTDLSIASPGVKSDFVRTYNSMSDEEGSFGIGWDFNIDVSKIVIPAAGYYQVVLPDGSNTTFKDDGNGGCCPSQLSVAEVHWGTLETILKSIIRGYNNFKPRIK